MSENQQKIDGLENIDWQTRALAAEKTAAILSEKVYSLYNGEASAVQKQLERARQREEENRRKRDLIAAKAGALEEYSKNLEQEVARQTKAMRTVVDNVAFGFLLVTPQFTVAEGFTKSCIELLQTQKIADQKLADLLCIYHAKVRGAFEVTLDQVFEDILPEETALSLLPARFAFDDGRILHAEWRAVRDEQGNPNSPIMGILLSLTDGRALEQAQQEAQENKTLVTILKQKEPFASFIEDVRQQIYAAENAIVGKNHANARRAVHTIKGNAAIYGLNDVVSQIHKIEEKPTLDLDALHEIENAFRKFLNKHQKVLELAYDGNRDEKFTVKPQHVEELRLIARSNTDVSSQINRWANRVVCKPARALLGPIEELVCRLAERLGKEVDFALIGEDVLVDTELMRPVMRTLAHMIRNSLDHGLETRDERGQKSGVGYLEVAVRDQDNTYILQISDDGRGINGDTLLQKAIEKNFVTPEESANFTDAQKVNLIFLDGLSSADEATDISGRGVGMSAVLGEVSRLGGRVDLWTRIGEGTRISLLIPKREAGAVSLTNANPESSTVAAQIDELVQSNPVV